MRQHQGSGSPQVAKRLASSTTSEFSVAGLFHGVVRSVLQCVHHAHDAGDLVSARLFRSNGLVTGDCPLRRRLIAYQAAGSAACSASDLTGMPAMPCSPVTTLSEASADLGGRPAGPSSPSHHSRQHTSTSFAFRQRDRIVRPSVAGQGHYPHLCRGSCRRRRCM